MAGDGQGFCIMSAQHGAPGPGGKRRMRGFARVSVIAAPLTRAAGAPRGFAEHRLLTDWPSVAGAEFAQSCRPVKVGYRGKDAGLGATLVLEADGARATEVAHMAPQIIERVNQVYGYRAISRIRVVQIAGGAGGFAGAQAAFDDPPPLDMPASPDISGVQDDGLRAALARLEANIRRKAARAARMRS